MKVGHVILPVEELGAALAFYSDGLGLPLKFRDGDRYAALDGGGTTIALAAPAEQPAPGRTVVSFKVDDLPVALDRIRAHGGTVGEIQTSAHEHRAVVVAPDGTVLVVYAPPA